MQKFLDMVIDSALQLIFRKLPLSEFCFSSKKNIHNYMKNLLKYFYNRSVWGLIFFITSTKITYCNRLNISADVRV